MSRRRELACELACAVSSRAARSTRAPIVPDFSTLESCCQKRTLPVLQPTYEDSARLKLRDMSTTGARKRGRSRRPKLTFGSTSSATRNLPSNMQATLEELFANLTLQRAPSEDKRRRCDEVAGNASEQSASKRRSEGERPRTPETASSDTHKDLPSPAATKLSSGMDYGTSASEVVQSGTSFTGEAEGDVEQERRAISETNVASIVNQMRDILRENGPTQEDDLLEALGPSQTRVILEAHGTLTAFLDQRPGFRVLCEDLYTFVYYQDPEEDDEACGRSTLVKIEATTAPNDSSVVRNSGRQQAAAGDGGPQRVRSNSSSSDSYESAVDGEEEERESRRYPLKNGFTRVPSRPRHSRAGQVVKHMRDAEVQTQAWYPNPIAELEYTLQKRKAEITELQEALKTLQLSQARELQQLRTSISKLLKRPPPTPPWSVTGAAKTRIGVNERKPTAAFGACVQDSLLPRPWALRPRHPPLRPKPEKQRALAIDPRSQPLPSVDKKSRRSLKRPPLPEFLELPGRVQRHHSGPTVDKKFRRSAKPTPEFPELPSRDSRLRRRVPSLDRKSRRSLKRPPMDEFPELPGRERRHSSGPTVDKKPKKSVKQSPEPEFPGTPGRQTPAPAQCPELQSISSSPPGGYATRSRTEQQVSRTPRRAANEQPNNVELENRSRADNSRRPQDGFSRMNFNAIVALMLGHPDATSQAKP